MKQLTMTGACILALVLSACSKGPLESGPIGVSVNTINESDVDSLGFLEKDENIGTQTGNSWGEFIKAAEAECSAEPTGFKTMWVSLSLDVDKSQNATVLEDVITGPVTIFFSSTRGSDAAAVRVNVATATSVSGVGPVPLTTVASKEDLSVLRERLEGGDFHVGIRAKTNLPPSASFTITVDVIFSTRAYCN